MKLLVTGGAGFIGSNFIRYILENHSQWEIVNLDKLTYAGNLENLHDVEGDERYRFVRGDIADYKLVSELLAEGFDVVVNFAAESHVDRSIADSSVFIKTNIKGAQVLLEAIRKKSCGLFVQVSTDEVYGSILEGAFKEDSPIMPNSPYSASKASADLLCRSYFQTYDLPVIVTRCSNNFGPYQFPEKLIPLSITNLLEGKSIPVYGDGLYVRDWIYVLDHCRAIESVIEKGKAGEIYNVGASNETTNLQMIESILQRMNISGDVLTFVKDRPGHDRRYAIDSSKISLELGWKPIFSFEEALSNTVNWYVGNRGWWSRVQKGEHLNYNARVCSEIE